MRLRRRPEFRAVAASGLRWTTPAFVLQAGPRPPAGDGTAEAGLGFTVTRRIGKAVTRNRARRRLRAAVRAILPGAALPGFNYVVVARPAALTCPFTQLTDDMNLAFSRIVRRAPCVRRGRSAAGSRPAS